MIILLFVLGLAVGALGGYFCYMRKTLKEPISAKVTGYEEGEAYVRKTRGSKGNYRVKAWYPLVTYSVNGETYNHTCRNSYELSEPVKNEGKTIQLLYNPAAPDKCVEADVNQTGTMIFGVFMIIIGVVLMVLSFVVKR